MIIGKRCVLAASVFMAMSSYAGMLDNPNAVFEHFPNVNVDAHVYRIAQKYSLGGVSDNCSRNIDWDRATPREMALWFRETLNVWVGDGKPVKTWRASNLIDMWTWHRFRTDAFWISTRLGERGKEMNPLICGLMRVKSYEVLKAICEEDDCARDLIIGIGLVCKDLPLTKRVAKELAPQSEVNWPVYALRIPIADARKLLGGREEYARLLSNLEIRAMKPGLGVMKPSCGIYLGLRTTLRRKCLGPRLRSIHLRNWALSQVAILRMPVDSKRQWRCGLSSVGVLRMSH